MPDWLKTLLKIIIVVLLILYAFSMFKTIWTQPRTTQWDFLVYYYAAQAFSEGLNPYLLESLSSVSGEELQLTYVYPPNTLPFFRILNFFSYDTAHRIWLVLKLISLSVLICLWRGYFIKNISLLLILFFTLFAFNFAI